MHIRTLLFLALVALAATLAPEAHAQQLLYIHADHLNTPRLVTNGAGTPVRRWDQTEPFGDNPSNEDPDNNGSLGHMPLRFPGQYFDKETNLAYNYFRDYDPATGRYIQSDPIGVAGLAITTGRIPSIKDFAASWFSTLPSAGAINFRAVMSLPLIETPMVNDLPRWSGLSLYSYVEGNPLTYIDADALIPKPSNTEVPSKAPSGPDSSGSGSGAQLCFVECPLQYVVYLNGRPVGCLYKCFDGSTRFRLPKRYGCAESTT